ncbi:MAG TPA: hypothetical protein VL856_18425 [Acidimicrobiia bacterium]|jgi:hypothetical protein|nr:hypothetical protein [Acidimicrobiia bacterium]
MFKLFRRFFWLVLGIMVGWTSSWALTRRMRRVAERYMPAEVVDRWSGTMRAAVSEGREAMRAREAELKGTVSTNQSK